jgi:hypothetical protein
VGQGFKLKSPSAAKSEFHQTTCLLTLNTNNLSKPSHANTTKHHRKYARLQEDEGELSADMV